MKMKRPYRHPPKGYAVKRIGYTAPDGSFHLTPWITVERNDPLADYIRACRETYGCIPVCIVTMKPKKG